MLRAGRHINVTMPRNEVIRKRWAIRWHSKNSLDGRQRYLMWDYGTMPLLFKTRREAREYRNEKWGYIRDRKDLRSEPHGWRLPQVVRVRVTVEVLDD